jgi:hypothetical protein
MEPITTLGKIITKPQQRDAIHIAIAPVVAEETLAPGQAVAHGDHIGVVDPFLTASVRKGQTFWLMLYPNTIRGLRHEWTHPAFSADPVKAMSEEWLRQLADRMDRSYEDVLEMGREGVATGAAYAGDDSAQTTVEDVKDEFWTHYEIVSGQRVTPDQRENIYFRCAC